ncbi:S8 family serine peptidase [Streptomyces sp. cg28]|uniref:S8 family serine peptidase n=1 Tax=Streptomyces sp. cg28 TaxID=3403457 RepID=UPI003B216EC6
MRFTQTTLRAVGGAAMVGALVLGTAPAASADATRKGQWQNEAFTIDATHKIATGKGVTVAVLDDGVDGNHPDLKGSVLPGERCKDGQPANQEVLDDHGTGMASLIAAHGHGPGNSQGMLGIAPDAKILPVDVYKVEGGSIEDDHPSACTYGKAIRYAVDQGADVISISNSSGSATVDDTQAIAYANAHNVVVVQSSGNDGTINNGDLGSAPGGVLVGGSNQNGTPWEDENYSKTLMFTAPAKDITVATANGDYMDAGQNKVKGDYLTTSGTSMSAAIASGTFALLKQKFPDYTAGQLVNRVIKSTYIAKGVDKAKLPDEYHGYGDLSPYKALTADIPKGGESGPWDAAALSKADKNGTGNASPSPATGAAASDSSDDDSSNTLLYVGIGAGVLIVIVLIVVLATRKKNNNSGGPGNPGSPGGWGGPGAPQQPYQNQPYQQQPYGQQQPYPQQPPAGPYGGQQQGGHQGY